VRRGDHISRLPTTAAARCPRLHRRRTADRPARPVPARGKPRNRADPGRARGSPPHVFDWARVQPSPAGAHRAAGGAGRSARGRAAARSRISGWPAVWPGSGGKRAGGWNRRHFEHDDRGERIRGRAGRGSASGAGPLHHRGGGCRRDPTDRCCDRPRIRWLVDGGRPRARRRPSPRLSSGCPRAWPAGGTVRDASRGQAASSGNDAGSQCRTVLCGRAVGTPGRLLGRVGGVPSRLTGV
jgi:hypothetical protein